jgi:hypothetical protein
MGRALVTRLLLVLALAVASGACSTTRALRPVGEKKVQVGGSLGGPLFTNLGPPYPAPLFNVYGRYGLTDRLTLELGLNPTVVRAFGIEAGASYQLLKNDRFVPRVMIDGLLVFYVGLGGLTGQPRGSGTPFTAAPRLFEHLQGTAAWDVGPFTLYAGLNLFAQLERLIVLPTLLGGVEWRPVKSFGLQLEVKQMAFTQNQRFAVVEFLGPGNFGAFAVHLGVNVAPGAN